MNRKPTILVLGTSHLDNPNNGDMFMTQTEDLQSFQTRKPTPLGVG